MPVPLIPCRHRDTGAEVELPETALRYGHMPTYEPVEDADRERIRALQDADKAAAAAEQADDTTPSPPATPDSTPADPPAPADTTAKSKPATGAAKKQTKE